MDKLEKDPNFLKKFDEQYLKESIEKIYLFQFYNQSANIIRETVKFLVDDPPFTNADHIHWMLQNIQVI